MFTKKSFGPNPYHKRNQMLEYKAWALGYEYSYNEANLGLDKSPRKIKDDLKKLKERAKVLDPSRVRDLEEAFREGKTKAGKEMQRNFDRASKVKNKILLSMKKSLIRLGNTNPSLRKNIKVVLDSILKE